jgi:hypothetical protein
MTQPAKAQEPTMEEILASIRRIIADDDSNKSPPRPADPPKAAAPPARPAPPPTAAPRAAPPAPSPIEAAPEAAMPEMSSIASDVEEQSSDILDLTESMATPTPPAAIPAASSTPGSAPQFRTIDGSSDVGFDDVAEGHASAPDVFSHSRDEREQLVSTVTSAAVDSAFNTLAQTVLVQNARTLEDLVREMLRPLLKAWLDDNLPGMVERLVRAEIERVSRGRAA